MKNNWLKKVLIFLVIVNLVMLVTYAFAFYFNNKEFISTDGFNTLNLSVDDNVNLASPDVTDKEYLGNGVYNLGTLNVVDRFYNVYNGIYTYNGLVMSDYLRLYNFNAEPGYHTFNLIYVGGGDLGDIVNIQIYNNDNFISSTPVATGDNFTISYNFTGTSNNYFRIVSNKTGYNYNNYQFKLQIEKGTTATAYQVPKEPQIFYENMIYNNAYNEGFNNGYDEGFNEGLDQVFNPNNLMTVAELKGKGTTGPSIEYFGFTIPLNIKVDRVTILNLDGYSLKPLTWSGGANIYQGILFNYQGGSSSYSFKNVYDEYEQLMDILVDESKILTSITLVLAINNPSMPAPDFENMQNHMLNNLGVYINNKVITDNAIDKFKGIIEADVRDSLDDEYQQKYDALYSYKLSQEWQLGYDEGSNEKDAYGFTALLKSIFIGIGSFLAIPLLPKITIGAILSVPLVFGIIFFIIGKRKGD